MRTKMKIMMLVLALAFGINAGLTRADITTGLIGYWPLDGDATDGAGSNNGVIVDDPDITLANGVPTYDNDVAFPGFGTSLRIPGTGHADWQEAADDYVDLGSAPEHDAAGAGEWTIAVWVKSGANNGTLFSNGGDDGGGIRAVLSIGEDNSDGQPTLTTDDNSDKRQAHSSTDIRDGNWHHIVGMKRGNNILIFVDGLPAEETVGTPSPYNLSGMSQYNSYIGCGHSNDSGDRPWGQHKQFDSAHGLIDEVRLYNRALTDADVTELFNFSEGSAGKKRMPVRIR